MKLMILMPAYNEGRNIENVVEAWYPIVESIGEGSRLVIANDGSTDDTSVILHRLAQEKPLLTVIDKPNGGHGNTLIHLYRHAVASGCEYIFQTDSDGQTNPGDFKKFWDDRDNHDIQIGHRINRKDGLFRRITAQVLKTVVFLVCGVFPKDTNTPFRLINSCTLQECIEEIPEDFFLTNVAITVLAMKKNKKTGWKSIEFQPRRMGKNSINTFKIFKIGIRAVRELSKL